MAIVSCKSSFSFFYILLIIIVSQTKAQPEFRGNFCINDNGNYTANSTYQTNLNILLSNLSSNTEINYGFYNFSYGQNTDKVNAIGLCRGDVKPDDCRNCLNDSRVLLTRLCPNQKEAIGWYDNCMLRYSNRSIFGIMEGSPTYYLWNPNNATDVDQFNQVLGILMKKLRERAASSDDFRVKYATGNETDVNLNFQTVYGLVQCTPDLSLQDCNSCLDAAISEIPSCCNNKGGGRVLKPSCNIRFESSLFYNPTPVVDTDETSPPQEKSKSSHTTTIAIVVLTVVVVLVLLTLIICICLRRNRHSMTGVNLEEIQDDDNDDDDDDIEIAESLQFNFDTIGVATNNFSEANKLGRGGFGVVYQGKLSSGQVIAVKSLDYFIFDPIKKVQLDWERRYKIIGASNILLDEDMNAKISDFGMARLLLVDQTQVNTDKIVGTYGYMAPEYAMFGQFTVKSDVFSFGVLVLEIISGHKINRILHGQSQEDLLCFAWRNWREGTIRNIIDPSLNNGSQNEIMRCIHIGLLCVQENLVDRPTMATIALMLSSYSLSMPLPLEPAYAMGGRTRSFTYTQSSEEDKGTTSSFESKSKSVNDNTMS
ncbi:putative receptor protein kinase [Trifolium repens]|nr:putative receptor protein kinase [Trifolium repens]